MTAELPEVLFVCVHSAGPSQMAAALLDHHEPIAQAQSASEPEFGSAPRSQPDGLVGESDPRLLSEAGSVQPPCATAAFEEISRRSSPRPP